MSMVHEKGFLGEGCLYQDPMRALGDGYSEGIIKFLLTSQRRRCRKAHALLCLEFARLVLEGMISDGQIFEQLAEMTSPNSGVRRDNMVRLDLAEDMLNSRMTYQVRLGSYCGEDGADDNEVYPPDGGRRQDPNAQVVGEQRLYRASLLSFVPAQPLPPQRRPIRDVALTKFDASISKKYADRLAGFCEEERWRIKTCRRRGDGSGACAVFWAASEAIGERDGDNGPWFRSGFGESNRANDPADVQVKPGGKTDVEQNESVAMGSADAPKHAGREGDRSEAAKRISS
ncbi:hypothetical protein OG21DRAFT_1546401 [Imleria badia]|nr:hypothetical protein OG21DRAFT_1546401 [Imleria badia]